MRLFGYSYILKSICVLRCYIYIIYVKTFIYIDYISLISVSLKVFTTVHRTWDLFPFFTFLEVAATRTKTMYVTSWSSKLYCIVRSDWLMADPGQGLPFNYLCIFFSFKNIHSSLWNI